MEAERERDEGNNKEDTQLRVSMHIPTQKTHGLRHLVPSRSQARRHMAKWSQLLIYLTSCAAVHCMKHSRCLPNNQASYIHVHCSIYLNMAH